MKKLVNIFFILFVVSFFISCEDDKDPESMITKPAVVTVNGDETVYVIQGQTYTEDGATVEGGTLYKTVGNVATQRPGTYSIKYIGVNSDGAFTTAERSVIVLKLGDNSIDLSGTYGGYRGAVYGADITLTKIADGIYSVSDLFGGYYEYFRGYGSAYRATGLIRYEGDGVVIMPVDASSPWGAFNFMDGEGVFDVNSGKLTYKVLFEDGSSIATEFNLIKK